MKYFILLILLPFSFLTVFSTLWAQKKEQEKPNVIIIFADDMGYGDVSYLNPDAKTFTPHIDNLAQNGLSFSKAHASASVCTPSRYGLLTGRYAWRSASGGRVVNGFEKPVIEPGRETLAMVFKKEGYTTACIGKWHLGLDWQTQKGSGEAKFDAETGLSNLDFSKPVTLGPNDYGFDYSFIHPASLDMPPYVFVRDHKTVDPEVQLTSDVYPDRLDDTEYFWDRKHTREKDVYWDKMVWWRRGEISKSFRVENCLSDILDEGISFMERHALEKPSEPFFLYLPLTGPHSPWVPTDQFKGKSSIGTYGDFMMDIDHVVGQVAATLQRLGMADNTILIFSSDNGAYWPESEIDLQSHEANWGTRGQKGDIWDGGHRIPLIMSWPARIKEKQVYPHLVSLTDLFATFKEMAGQNPLPDSGEDSFSFLHAINGDLSKITRKSMVHQSSGGLYGIRNEEWKYINGLGSGGFTAPSRIDPEPGGPRGQLYRIKNDSLESSNLFLQYPEITRELQQELEQQVGKKLESL